MNTGARGRENNLMWQRNKKNNAINGKTFSFLNNPPGVILVFLIIRGSACWQPGALIIIPRSRLWNNLSSGVDRLTIIDLQLPEVFMLFEVWEGGEAAGRWQIRRCWTTDQISPGLSVLCFHSTCQVHLPMQTGGFRKKGTFCTKKMRTAIADKGEENCRRNFWLHPQAGLLRLNPEGKFLSLLLLWWIPAFMIVERYCMKTEAISLWL